MPRSKRDKKISLTKTSKKGLNLKQQLIKQIRKDVESFPNIYVFDVQNMRNAKLKSVRGYWKDSRFFFGKRRIMALALGKSPEDEISENISQLSPHLTGQCGLLFTSRPKADVLKWFKTFEEKDYAKAGFIATETVQLDEGPLPDFPHSIEPHLRRLGLPTSLVRGVVTLIKDFTVCKTGDVLTPEQAQILKLLGNQMAVFKLKLRCIWSDGKFEIIKKIKSVKEKSPKSVKENSLKSVNENGLKLEKKRKDKLKPLKPGKKRKSNVINDVEMTEV